MDQIKFAVVGVGNIGRRHLAVIDADERSQLVAICDTDESICKEQSALYGDVAWYTDFSEMLAATDADVISICTPHGLHKEMAMDVAKAGKHSLVEKPMALSAQDSEEMIKCAEEHGTKLFVVKQNRYNTPIALTKDAILSGKLGKIFMVQCNVLWNRHQGYYNDSDWRGSKDMEGGALYTQVSHFIDLLIWWFGDITEARTLIDTLNHEIEIEDCGVSALRFKTGVIGSLMWTTCVYNKNYEGSITVIGEKGTIKVGGRYLNTIEFWDVQSYPLPEGLVFEDQPNNYGKYQGTSSNHDKVVNDISRKLLNERRDVVEGDEGIKSIEAIELIYNNQ